MSEQTTKADHHNDPLPRVSFLIPTLNAEQTLESCLAAIRTQNYPRDLLEIVIADACSTDSTLKIARKFDVTKVVSNPLKTGEAGKAAAAKAATGELFALIDSDNILPDANWLKQMVAPFSDPTVFASEPLEYTRRDEDPELTRYFAMLGMNDPLCLFIGNYDRTSCITGRWTNLNMETSDCGDWLKVCIRADKQIPTIGANGFIIRKTALKGINWAPYWFDVDIVRDVALAATSGLAHIAKVKCGIVHLYCRTLDAFGRKQERRVRDFLYFSSTRTRKSIPGEKNRILKGILVFSLSTIFGFPLILQRKQGMRVQPDSAWRMHGPVCRITLRKYAVGVIRKLLGFKQQPASRENWKQ